MKRILTVLAFALLCINLNAASKSTNWVQGLGENPEIKDLPVEMTQLSIDNFLSLTPKKYKEMTGQKLGLKKAIALKAAQKMVKKQLKGGQGDQPKSQLIALLLVVLIGTLGIHRFYLGYTTIGIIQLLTLGGCGIWALIDLIRIITGDLKPADGSEYNPKL